MCNQSLLDHGFAHYRTRGFRFERLAMVFPLILIAGVAAVQAQVAPLPPAPQRLGRAFMSPMGEPFYGRTPGEDGLTVWFAQADRNHDGFLTVDEMRDDAQRFFEQLDTNHDGEIDPDEITHYEVVVAPQFRVRSYFSAQNMPGGEQQVRYDDESGAGHFSLMQIPEPVASADSNFNRGVSSDEFARAAAARFKLLDVNRSGRLTLPELEDIRHAATSVANNKKRGSAPQSGPSDNPASAEYGRPSQPQ
jgi:Ca2+-binding EF-hand superfamily protein